MADRQHRLRQLLYLARARVRVRWREARQQWVKPCEAALRDRRWQPCWISRRSVQCLLELMHQDRNWLSLRCACCCRGVDDELRRWNGMQLRYFGASSLVPWRYHMTLFSHRDQGGSLEETLVDPRRGLHTGLSAHLPYRADAASLSVSATGNCSRGASGQRADLTHVTRQHLDRRFSSLNCNGIAAFRVHAIIYQSRCLSQWAIEAHPRPGLSRVFNHIRCPLTSLVCFGLCMD